MLAVSRPSSRALRRLRAATISVVVASGLAGCGRAADDGPDPNAQKPGAAPAKDRPAQRPSEPPLPASAARSLIPRIDRCQIHQGGIFIDVGREEHDRARLSNGLVATPLSEHEGSGFRVISSRVDIPFRIDEAQPAGHVQVRVAGQGRLQGALGGRSLGTLRVRSRPALEEPRVLSFPGSAPALEPGIHHLVLRPAGSRSDRKVEVDWALISSTAPEPGFRTPSQEALIRGVALGGDPRSALVLANGANVRCPIQLDGAARLSLDVGYLGVGEGVAQILVRRPGQPPVMLSRDVVRGAEQHWLPLNLDLTPYGPDAVLEFRAESPGDVGRVLFADPRIEESAPTSPGTGLGVDIPSTDLAVVIVAEGFGAGEAEDWQRLESLAWLAGRGVTFTNYRLPSPVSSASFATLLTGLSPDAHLLTDPGARLADDLDTLATRVTVAGGQAAMFTGVPTTFPSFGFSRGWDEFVPESPTDDESATSPLARATAWLGNAPTGQGPELLVVHLRGGHPPWDVDSASVAELPPTEYAGQVQPRRGGIALAHLRQRNWRLAEPDQIRIEALRRAAAVDLDAALEPLLALLRAQGRLAGALIVVAGGAPPGDGVPFSAAGNLRESGLQAPLLIKFPQGTEAVRARSLVTTADLYQTISDALRLPVRPPAGEDLFRVATSLPSPERRTIVAILGERYAARNGPWLLSGTGKTTPRLCALYSDPDCEHDRFLTDPIAAYVIWADTWAQQLAAEQASRGRVPVAASPDPATLSALTAWGM